MSATHFNTVDQFLGHKTSTGGSKFLKGWRDDGKLYAWLHTRQLPIGLWRHNFPQLVVKENRDTRKVERHIWGQSMNCLETEETLLKQNMRDKNTREREVLPTRCPCCRFIECIYQMVHRGELSWTDVILRFEGADNPKENRIIHAAGVYNGFSDYNNKLTDEQKAEIKKAGIYLSDAWQENIKSGLNYVFTLVNNDKIIDGVQVTIERSSLGDAVKKAINDTLESLGVEDGNPITNPYCIEFVYDKNKPMNDRYSARRIERIKLTPQIEELIRSEPPDLSNVLAAYNVREFRAQLEKHLTVEVDLDWIFNVEDAGSDAPTPTDEEREPRAAEVRSHAPAPKGGGRKVREPAPPPAEEPGEPCEKCKAPMTKTQTKCTGCGTEYEVDDPAPEPGKKKFPF